MAAFYTDYYHLKQPKMVERSSMGKRGGVVTGFVASFLSSYGILALAAVQSFCLIHWNDKKMNFVVGEMFELLSFSGALNSVFGDY